MGAAFSQYPPSLNATAMLKAVRSCTARVSLKNSAAIFKVPDEATQHRMRLSVGGYIAHCWSPDLGLSTSPIKRRIGSPVDTPNSGQVAAVVHIV